MRLPTALTSGVSAAAALLLLTACGGGDAEESASSSSSAADGSTQSSSAPESSTAEVDAQTFCTEAVTAGSDLDEAFTAAGTDATQVPALLAEVQSRFEAIEAPAAVADDWNAMQATLGRLSEAASSLDFAGDPNAFTTFTQTLAEEEAAYTEAESGVTEFMRTECGIDPATGETLPTS